MTDMDAPRPLPRPRWRDQPGHLRRIFQTPHLVLDDLNEQYGPACGLGAGPVRLAIVGDPEAFRELFAMPNSSFRWNHKFNVLGFVVGKQSMIVSDGEDHRRRRSSVQSAFSRRRLNGWIPMIVEQTDAAIDRLVERTEPGTVVDMYPVGRALVLQIVVRSLFGERMSRRCDEIGDLFQRPQDYLESPAIRQIPHPFPRTARARSAPTARPSTRSSTPRSRTGVRTRAVTRSTFSRHWSPTERSTMTKSAIRSRR